jgi:hypothetical protein
MHFPLGMRPNHAMRLRRFGLEVTPRMIGSRKPPERHGSVTFSVLEMSSRKSPAIQGSALGEIHSIVVRGHLQGERPSLSQPFATANQDAEHRRNDHPLPRRHPEKLRRTAPARGGLALMITGDTGSHAPGTGIPPRLLAATTTQTLEDGSGTGIPAGRSRLWPLFMAFPDAEASQEDRNGRNEYRQLSETLSEPPFRPVHPAGPVPMSPIRRRPGCGRTQPGRRRWRCARVGRRGRCRRAAGAVGLGPNRNARDGMT